MYKQANLSFSITAQAYGDDVNAIQFSTQDKNSAKLIFTIKEGKAPLNLADVDGIVDLVMGDKSVFEGNKAEIAEPLEGKLEYTITPEQIRHSGKARGELKLVSKNGQAIGGFRFTFSIKKALVDEYAGPIKEFYIHDLEAIKAEIEKTADSIKDIDVVRIDTKLNELEQKVEEGGVGVDEQARQEIQEVTEALADTARKSQLSDSNKLNLTPFLIDMHFEALKGVGWVNETSDTTKYPITSSASKGTKVIKANNTPFTPGQLICYTAKDGMYYSGVVSTVTTTQITLKTPLEQDIDTKCFIMAFYQNFSHGNKHGNATIADYGIRSLYSPSGVLTHRIPASKWAKYGGSHSTLVNARKTSDYTQPFGVDDVVNAQITTQNWGVQLDFTVEKAGLTKISLNVSADADGEIQLLISEYPTIIKYYANKILANSNVAKKETFYLNLDAGEYSIYLLSKKASGTANVFIGTTEIYHCQNNYDKSEFNKGVHMLLGDSWFYNDGFSQRLQENLPDATISNWGIGGNYLPNIINRFRGTATPSDVNNDPTRYAGVMDATKLTKIDYVWVMIGTNDYYGSGTAANFKKQLMELIDLIVSRGAKPIIFNTSVGAIENGKLDISRQYADIYFNLSPNVGTTKNYVLNFIKMTVPTGKSILAVGGQFSPLTRIYVDEIYFDYAENKEIEITFDDDIVNVNSPLKAHPLRTAYTKKLDIGSPPSNLWFNIVAVNNTGASATYTGYIRFRTNAL